MMLIRDLQIYAKNTLVRKFPFNFVPSKQELLSILAI